MKKVFWDITYQCNAKCKYCFTNSGVNPERDRLALTISEQKQLIDILIGEGIEFLSIGGGEPFIKNIGEIVGYAAGKINISITTNGILLDEKNIRLLEKYKIKVTISLDTIDRTISEKIRSGIDLSKVMLNIANAAQNEIVRNNMSIRATVTKDSLDGLEQLVDFADQLNIPKLKINSTNFFGRAKRNVSIIPEFSCFMGRLQEIEEYCAKNNFSVKVEMPISKYLGKKENICTLGKSSMYITPEGNVYPCAFSEGQNCMGNIIKDGYSVIKSRLENFNYQNRQCTHCPIHRYE